MSNFAAQIAAFKREAIERCGSVHRAVAIQLFSDVIMDTPVLTGRLRGNWKVSINVPDRSEGSPDKSGSRGRGRIESVLAGSRTVDALILTNSLPYAYRIEYEGWSRNKSPLGMMRRNIVRFKSILRDELQLYSHRL